MNNEKLKSLFGNDQNMVDQFIALFKSEIPNEVNGLKKALEVGDMETVTLKAHGIKSQVKYLELHDIASLAYDIEKKSESTTDWDDLQHLVDSLDEKLSVVIRNL